MAVTRHGCQFALKPADSATCAVEWQARQNDSVARRPDEINAMDNRRSLIYRCIDLIEGGLGQVRSGHSGYTDRYS